MDYLPDSLTTNDLQTGILQTIIGMPPVPLGFMRLIVLTSTGVLTATMDPAGDLADVQNLRSHLHYRGVAAGVMACENGHHFAVVRVDGTVMVVDFDDRNRLCGGGVVGTDPVDKFQDVLDLLDLDSLLPTT